LFVFPEGTAFLFICGFYLLDQMLMSVNMARSMYMKKIAIKEEHIQPALTAGLTIDHFFSLGIALLGGVIWNLFGFQYVFLIGVVIAGLGFLAASRIQTHKLPTVEEVSPVFPVEGD
jgi:hypothetical protein